MIHSDSTLWVAVVDIHFYFAWIESLTFCFLYFSEKSEEEEKEDEK